jgi:hypothetical protein
MADGTKQVNYEITADHTGFTKSVTEAATQLTGFTDQVKKQFGGIGEVFEKIQKPLLAMTAIIGGGAFFKEAIGVTNKLNGEAMGLSKALGITGDEAATLRTALGDIYSDSDTYIGAFQKFAKSLKSNEEGLQSMGLQTRDANGHLRDSNTLFTEALGVVGSYKPGLDQTTAAMTLFGKGVDDVMKLQKLNNGVLDDARAKNEALGMSLTKEGVEASKAYKAAMNDVGDVLEAIKNTVGQAVMPVFTELGNFFAESGPNLVMVFKGALTMLLGAFRAVEGAVKTVAGVVFEAISTIIDVGGLLGDVFSKLFQGDFSGAAESAKQIGSRIGQGFKNAFMNFMEVGDDAEQKFRKDMERVWGQGTKVGAPKRGARTMGDFGKTNEGKGDKSQMPELEAELEAKRVALTKQGQAEGQYRELSKAEEAAFWRAKSAMANLSAEDRAKAAKKASEAELTVIKEGFAAKAAAADAELQLYRNNMDKRLEIARGIQAMYGQGTKEYEQAQAKINEIERAAAEQTKQVAQLKAQAKRDALLGGIALEEQQVQQELQLQVISQQEYLAAQQQFEQRRYAIANEALQQRLTDMERDPDKNPVELARIHAEIEALERQHQARLGQVKNAAQLDKLGPVNNVFKSAENSLGTAIQGMITKTMSLKQAMQSIWRGIGTSIIGEISKILAAKAVMFAKEKLMALFGIQTDAAKAASGAAASQAAIPVVGPAMAATSAASTMAMVAGFAASLPSFSAEGGFDIPGTLSPIVQTHPREMILPAKQADVIRDMADGGGAGGGFSPTINVRAMDARGVAQALRQGGALAEALRTLRRDFVRVI